MRNPFRFWLRLLGLTGEPESFVLPEPPEVVRQRLLRVKRRDGLDVRPWLDGALVLVPVDFGLLPDRPYARVRVALDGAGSRVDVTYGLRFWAKLAAYALPWFAVVCVATAYEAVTTVPVREWWRGFGLVAAMGTIAHTLVQCRRGMVRLRERIPGIVRD